jgi:hypothetical protein
MSLNVLERQASKMVNGDTCPRPTTGSSPTLYHREGAAGSRHWLVFFEGGGACTSGAECAAWLQ